MSAPSTPTFVIYGVRSNLTKAMPIILLPSMVLVINLRIDPFRTHENHETCKQKPSRAIFRSIDTTPFICFINECPCRRDSTQWDIYVYRHRIIYWANDEYRPVLWITFVFLPRNILPGSW